MSRLFNGGVRKPYERPTRPRASDGFWQHDRAPGIPASIANTNGNVNRNVPLALSNTKLVVSNLHYNVTAKDLSAIFGQIGTLVREPHIKYDRSGRSTGIAYITYDAPVEATRAKKQFDGILAKGQPMSIAYDTAPPPRARALSAPGSLMDRIQKRPLIERLRGDSVDPPKRPTAPAANGAGGGPVRSHARRRGAGAGRPASARKQPKTAEELDQELDAFMGDDSTPAARAAPEAEMDVEMTS